MAITNMCCYTSYGSSPHGAAVVLAKENAYPRETNLIQLGLLPLKECFKKQVSMVVCCSLLVLLGSLF